MSRLQNLINGNSGTSYGARLNSLTPTQMTVPQIAPPIAEEKASQNNGGFFGGLGYLGEKIGLGFLSGIEGIWDYTAGGIAKLFGADDWAEQQFANDWAICLLSMRRFERGGIRCKRNDDWQLRVCNVRCFEIRRAPQQIANDWEIRLL